MSDFQEAVASWPSPKVAGLPFRVEKGRSWSSIAINDVPEFIGRLFDQSEAQAIKLSFKAQGEGLYSVTVVGTSCPPVPYSTLSGEQISQFMRFMGTESFELSVHSEFWFWVPDIDEEELENLVDRFMASL